VEGRSERTTLLASRCSQRQAPPGASAAPAYAPAGARRSSTAARSAAPPPARTAASLPPPLGPSGDCGMASAAADTASGGVTTSCAQNQTARFTYVTRCSVRIASE